MNELAMDNIKEGDICNVNVRIIAKDGESSKVIFERDARYQKKDDKAVLTNYHPLAGPNQGVHFQISKVINKDTTIVSDPEYTVERIFPQRIRKYFFFNGEKLDEYFKGQGNEKIKEEVFNISQLHLFETVIEHVTKCRDLFGKDLKGANPEADKVKDLLDETNENLKDKQAELKKLLAERTKADKLIAAHSNKLRGASSSQVRKLQQERDELDAELKK